MKIQNMPFQGNLPGSPAPPRRDPFGKGMPYGMDLWIGKPKNALGKDKHALPRESFGSGRLNMLFPGNPLDRES